MYDYLTRPFTRFGRSYGELMDFYSNFWHSKERTGVGRRAHKRQPHHHHDYDYEDYQSPEEYFREQRSIESVSPLHEKSAELREPEEWSRG